MSSIKGALRAALRRRLVRSESGSAMVVVLLLIAVLAAFTPVMVNQIDGNAGLVLQTTEQRASLEAADAGVQWYENHLNTDPAYSDNTTGAGPSGVSDPAMGAGNWCTSATAGCGLPSSAPAEAFHYLPVSGTGADAGEVLLQVTGRAGSAAPFAYTTELATFARSSILDNVYFSNYELLDKSVIQSYVDDSTASASDPNPPVSSSQYDVTVVNAAAGKQTTSTESVLDAKVTDPATDEQESLWNAVCGYYTYQQNAFIDAIGNIGDGTTYSASSPYYGPFIGSTLKFTQGSETISSSDASSLCGGQFEFISSDSFNGPVYTEDQLHICGDPSFNGSPVSYTSGAPSDLNYGYDVPGSVLVTKLNSGPGKTYPTPPAGTTVYSPGGVIEDSGCSNAPVYLNGGNNGPVLNGDEAMPATNSGLLSLAQSEGCVYSGPTVIELVTVSGTTTMDVWSPLSGGANSVTSAACGSPAGTTNSAPEFSTTSPQVNGIALPENGVVYVTGSSASTGPSVPDCVDANAPSATSGAEENSGDLSCTEGTAFVEGELAGQLTIAAEDNIVITRDLTYHCADGSGGASNVNPSTLEACTDSSKPDVLGLDAGNDVILARPDAPGALTYCTYDGTGAPSGVQWPNCEMKSPIVDAAVIATQGSFGVQSYDQGAADGNAQLNGADVSDYRGPFGTFTTCASGECVLTGYNKAFSFDTRLAYLTPPGLLGISSADWHETSLTLCGNGDPEDATSLSCP